MAIKVQVLKDANEVDHGPLMEFCQWAREHDGNGYFAEHYSWQDAHSDIIDLGSLHDELTDYFQDVKNGVEMEPFDPAPPDIRAWLKEQVDIGIVLAWVGW